MSTKKPDWRPSVTAIEAPIAEDWWECTLPDGTVRTSHIRIGRPIQLQDRTDWYCPVQMLGWAPNPDPAYLGQAKENGIRVVYGVGPVDALQNAMGLLSTLFEGLGVAPNAGKPPDGDSPSS